MDDLGVALRQLAGQVTAPGVGEPERLWQQGRARVRRRRVAGAVVAALVLGLMSGIGTYVAVPTSAVVPAGKTHVPAVPKNIWPAPDWIPSTKDVGPLGTVAAMAPHGTYPHEGRFVVSATTGEYRLLDLPDYLDFDSEVQMQLAPDGNHIGYFYRDPSAPKSTKDLEPSGFAIYDTRSGDVERFAVPVPDGSRYSAYGTQSMLWLDSETIGFYGVLVGPGETIDGDLNYVWNVGDPSPEKVDSDVQALANIGPANMSGVSYGMVKPFNGRTFAAVDTTGAADLETTVTLPRQGTDETYTRVGRQGQFVIASTFGGFDGGALYGRVEADGRVERLEPVDEVDSASILGWLNDEHVLVFGPDGQRDDAPQALYTTDLRDGSTTRLGTASAVGDESTNSGGTPLLQVATDLLDRPMVTGVRPSVTDPRLRLAIWAAAGAAALVGLIVATAFLLRRLRIRRPNPSGGGASAASLGRRIGRWVSGNRLASALLAVAVVLVGVGTLASGPEPLVLPEASRASAGMPDRVVTPPGWLPSTSTPGNLALLGTVDRVGGAEQVFGIEADTGHYRALDLADRTPATPVALSPSGDSVAFWQGDDDGTTGLAVLDFWDGTYVGLDAGAPSGTRITGNQISWLDRDTVLLAFDTQAGEGQPARSWTETWQPYSQGPREIQVWSRWALDRDGGVLFHDNEEQVPGRPVHWTRRVAGDADSGGVPLVVERPGITLPNGDYKAVSSSSSTVVAVERSATGLTLQYGGADDEGRVDRLEEIPDLDVARLLGWSSADSVLVTGARAAGGPSLFRVDLTTGTATRVGSAGDGSTTVVAVADDLLEKPLVAGNPPRGMDPRIARGLLGAGVLVAAIGVIRWRRRARQ